MKTTKLEEALEILNQARREGGQKVGLDSSCIEDPALLLLRRMKIGRPTALCYLKELASKGAVVLYKKGAGQHIDSAQIMKKSLEPVFHEEDEDERLVRALWRHKHRSEFEPEKYVVHSRQFDLVWRDADLSQVAFYAAILRLKGYGWVRIIRKSRNNRIMFVVITARFPAPQ